VLCVGAKTVSVRGGTSQRASVHHLKPGRVQRGSLDCNRLLLGFKTPGCRRQGAARVIPVTEIKNSRSRSWSLIDPRSEQASQKKLRTNVRKCGLGSKAMIRALFHLKSSCTEGGPSKRRTSVVETRPNTAADQASLGGGAK